MSTQQAKDALLLAKRPIFDVNNSIWGYELLRKDSIGSTPINPEPAPDMEDKDTLALDVASSGYITLQQIFERGKRAIIGFGQKGILDNAPYALPSRNVGVKVASRVGAHERAMNTLKQLADDKYILVVTGYRGEKEGAALARMAGVLHVSLNDNGEPEKDIVASCKGIARETGAKLLAGGVSSKEGLPRLKEMGFSLFEGSFFKEPEIISGRALTSHELSRFALLRIIESTEPDMEELTRRVEADVSIGFRLLTYLNSAAFGFSQKVASIKQATSLLGWVNIKVWLRLILLADLARGEEKNELLLFAVQRGKFMELVARGHRYLNLDPDALFLLGELSLLDAMLDMPMNELLKYLPIADTLKGALMRERYNELLPLLQLAECFEQANWDELEPLMALLSLDFNTVCYAVFAASAWVERIFAPQGDPRAMA